MNHTIPTKKRDRERYDKYRAEYLARGFGTVADFEAMTDEALENMLEWWRCRNKPRNQHPFGALND